MKQIEVTIMGQSYLLGCPEGGEASLQAAVASVDREMCAIRDAGRVKARERIAVLAALNLAFQLAEKGREAAQRHREAADDAADPRLTQLVQRLDEALNDDGRLL
jgi:cell division protein ZapA